ncbi:DUF3077 domain-containing protein [Pseudomonas sp. PB3P13]
MNKNSGHKKAPGGPTPEAYEAVNISEDIHMSKHTEVNEKLNAGAICMPVTVELSFTICNPNQEHLLAVRPGVPVTDALEEASCILSELKSSLEAAAMGVDGITPNQAWLLYRAANTAKVIVDSTHAGLESAQ